MAATRKSRTRSPSSLPKVASLKSSWSPGLDQDKQLLSIFEKTYGKVTRQEFRPQAKPARTNLSDKYEIRQQPRGPEYLLVDGYNIIFAWDELKSIAQDNLDAARKILTDILANHRGFRGGEVILVFDAYKVKGNPGSVEKSGGVYLVYTKEAETADAYIERTTYELARHYRVRVATSDGPEQLIILGHGALRMSAQTLRQEIESTQGQISAILAAQNRGSKSKAVQHAMEKALKQKNGKGGTPS